MLWVNVMCTEISINAEYKDVRRMKTENIQFSIVCVVKVEKT